MPMNIPNPNELHRQLKNDPLADLGQIVPGDHMCLFATHVDGHHSVAGDFTIGRADDQIGEMLDDLIAQEVGDSGGQDPASPVVSVEIIHACRVLLPWKHWTDLRCWCRETPPEKYGVVVRVEGGAISRARIDVRAEIDQELIRAGWRLL